MSAQQTKLVGNEIGQSKGIRNWQTSTLVIGVFVIVFGFLTITSFTQQSPTIDEPIHLFAGYSYLKWGDFRINPEHPPLAKIWAALPLLWLNINDPRSVNLVSEQKFEINPVARFYPLAEHMLFVRNDAARLFFYAKSQMLVLSFLLALFVYIWTRELFGPTAALVALFLYGLDPNIIAHSTIIHTDLPFALVFFIGTYAFWKCLWHFNGFNLILTSLCFALAVGTKFSYVWILPVWATLGFIRIYRAEPSEFNLGTPRLLTTKWSKAGLLGALFAVSGAVAYFVLWAAYGFHYHAGTTAEPSLSLREVLPQSAFLQNWVHVIADHRLFPESWIYGQLYVLSELTRPMYFLGEVSKQGYWLYFPVAFLVKTPLPTILLFFVSIWAWARNRHNRLPAILLLAAGVYFCGAMVSRLNIGLRHVLPVYPFLFVVISGTILELWRTGSRIKKSGLIVLGLWYLCSTLFVYPHYLAYFNELIGGAKNGHKVLLDSNLDWGQDLKGLKKWMDENAVKKVQLFYFGTAAPKYYGIDDFYSTENLSGATITARHDVDLPEHFAVSANFLYGGELFLPGELVELLASYRLGQPVATVGYSILIYKLNLADPRVYENAAVMTARKGALDLATLLLEKALQKDPSSANGYLQLGNVSAQRAEWEQAIENFRKAVKLNPDLAEGHYNLGRILIAQGRVEQAIENFRETLRLKPDHPDAHHGLAQALVRQGKMEEAAQHYQEALRILRTGGAGKSAVK